VAGSDNQVMDTKLQKCARLCHSSHFLTVIVLTAVAIACLIPLSARPTAMHGDASHIAARSTPGTSTAPIVPVTTATTVPASTTTQPTPTTTPVTIPEAPVSHPIGVAVEASQNVAPGYGCAPALAYLEAHAAPGFTFECPGWAYGHQAMTCVDVAGVCSGTKVIAISIPCPAAYMNEASNSWVVLGESKAPLDPYGYCQ
jgi:hypothetical protein